VSKSKGKSKTQNKRGFRLQAILEQNRNSEQKEGYLRLLRSNRDFRQLWLGQVVSQTGDWFNSIALFSLVLTLTGSGRAVGLVLVARFLPSVFCGPIAGVIADRFSRRSIMIVTDLIRVVIALGFLLVHRADQIWLVYLLTVLQLTASTFFEPARTAAIPSVVTAKDLVTANTISSATWSAVLTLSAALGGLVSGWLGTSAAFVIDSLSYLISAVLIVTIRLPKREPRPKSKLTIRKLLGITDTMEGLRYVSQRPRILATMLVKPAWGLGGGALTLLVVFGEKVFPIGGSASVGIGVLFAARGIGTAFGPILTRRFLVQTRQNMQTMIGVSFVFGSLFYMMFGVVTVYFLAIIALMIAHAGGSIVWVNSTVLLQASVEDNFRGRVFAAELALLTFMLAAANYATGELLDRFGLTPRTTAVIVGSLWLLPGLIWLATQRWWNKEQIRNAECGARNDEISSNHS
jgi:MFS family permease